MKRLLALALAATFAAQAMAQEYIWLEGEDAAKSSFVRHGWYDGVKKEMLSNNDWLSHYSTGRTGDAEWQFTLKEGGKYTIWMRTNPVRARQDYRIDGGEWTPCRFDDARQQQNLVDALDHRFICWIKAGKADLKAGRHTIGVQMRGEINNSGGIDCIVLTNFPWAPAGVRKPSLAAATVAAEDTWFPILPDDDEFSDESIIDMSGLLHTPAGKFGFVQRKGNALVFSNQPDQPVKFWGMVAGMTSAVELRDQQARFYAKHGINMVRQHPVQSVIGVLRTDPRTGKREFDKQRLDTWDRWFATLKKHGIYMTWSCFYPHVITMDDGYPQDLYDELPGRGQGKSSSGMVNFMPRLQDAEWEWEKALLLHKNPYTGLRYVDDPALAVIEVHNEDCIFFHSPLNTLRLDRMPKHAAVLRQLWMEWLKKRYGTDQKLQQAWGAGLLPGDSLTNPKMRIYGAWEMTAQGWAEDGKTVNTRYNKRMGDFIRFAAETQRSYYQRRLKRLRDLGYKAATITTAWRAGGPAADPANIWCDDAMDVISRHNYFGGGVGRHNIAVGNVNNATHMDQPGSRILSSGLYQVEDKPFVITEWTQLPPNQWKAESAPLFAFYGIGLQGWENSYHFAGSIPRIGNGWPRMRSYVTETPHYIGQFPALAFAIYKGHIKEAPIVAGRRLKPDEIFQGVDALSQDFTGGGYDQKETKGNLATPKEVLAIGRVTVKIDDGVPPATKVDWSRYWDKGRKVVKSVTGELTWDYGRRVVLVHSAKTQAVIGFAGGGTYNLPGVQVSVKTPFVSLIFTPLDDMPLIESKHILITAMAQDKQTGTEYNADGTQLLKGGGPPLLLEPVQADITLKGAAPVSVKVVDIYGVPTDKEVKVTGNSFSISGLYETYYYEIKR